jgi:hypothetical protein
MRKFITTAAAAMMIGVSATTVSAQVTTTLTMTSTEVYTNNGGGGWNATSSVGLGTGGLTSLVVYCFDDRRFFSFNTPTQYVALTFTQFLNNAGAGPGGRGANWNQLDLQDLNSIVAQIGGYTPNNLSGGIRASNGAIQQNIWNIGNAGNGTYAGPSNAYAPDWMVLVDKGEWERGLNGQNGFQGSQSFMARLPNASTTVPEPSTYALVAAGLAAMAAVSRRRRVS